MYRKWSIQLTCSVGVQRERACRVFLCAKHFYTFFNESSQWPSEGRTTILWMRRLRHRQFKCLLKVFPLAGGGSGTWAQVWVALQANAHNSTPGAGRPAAPAGSYFASWPLFSPAEASNGLMGQAPDHRTSQVTINRVSATGSGLCSPARWGSARSLSRVSSGGPTTWLVVCLQLGRTNGLRETHLALELQSHCYSFWWRRLPRMMSLKYLFYGSNCPYLCHSWF